MELTLPPTVTPRALERLREISAPVLRVAVEGGGCSGFQYEFEVIDTPDSEDLVLGEDDARIVIDPVSLPFLAGATIDYSEELIGSRFTIENPNATSSCGCGTSFSM